MKKNIIIYFSITAFLVVLFVVFTIIVKTVDVSIVGPAGSSIGLSHLNAKIFNTVGTSSVMDKLTDICLVLSVLVAFSIVCVGVVQLAKRKSLLKVDKSILWLALVYILVAIVYVFFEFVVINFRPIVASGQIEPSYPSSHTLIVSCIMLSSIFVMNNLFTNKILKYGYLAVSTIITIFNAVGRLLSGMHWFTDIVGAILLSAAIVMLYVSIISYLKDKSIQK